MSVILLPLISAIIFVGIGLLFTFRSHARDEGRSRDEEISRDEAKGTSLIAKQLSFIGIAAVLVTSSIVRMFMLTYRANTAIVISMPRSAVTVGPPTAISSKTTLTPTITPTSMSTKTANISNHKNETQNSLFA